MCCHEIRVGFDPKCPKLTFYDLGDDTLGRKPLHSGPRRVELLECGVVELLLRGRVELLPSDIAPSTEPLPTLLKRRLKRTLVQCDGFQIARQIRQRTALSWPGGDGSLRCTGSGHQDAGHVHAS